ncbi:TolB-like translocation protein [Cohnella fermenti]|uniref:Copper amine oxidase-like N-terminal domain-containing protein n=1 Tax=Cohnella fermenti TaxID=2565925 RepID=A0A4S4CA26_9BACL|nr:hypothetical protein [Cohnella fermenti]THF84617.1 hypothetical protein E6C55_01165 [Cohnella fermenti]
MKYRKLAISTAVALAIMGGGVISANYSLFKVSDDNYKVINVNGEPVLVPEISQQELQEIAGNALDVSELIEDPNKIKNYLKASVLAKVNDNGEIAQAYSESLTLPYEEGSLTLNKMEVGDTVLFATEKGVPNPELINSSNFGLYAFSSESGNIYLLNPSSSRITKISKDSVGEFDKTDINNAPHADVALQWAYSPLISEDNQIVSYMSNRRAIQNGDNFDDIWTINLKSGEESLLIKNSRSLFWKGRSLYFLDNSTNNIKSYNLDTEQVEDIVSNAEQYQSLDNKILAFSHPNNATVYFKDLRATKQFELAVDQASRLTFNFRLSPDAEKLLGTVFVDRKAASSRKIIVYNLESKSLKLFNIPSEKPELAEIQGWINNEQFIVTVYNADGTSSNSVIMNTNDEEVK